MNDRRAELTRKTKEVETSCRLNLDGTGKTAISTGIGFLDHMLNLLAYHAGFDIELTCKGDLEIDDHHSVEECALLLGAALNQALGDRQGVARFGWAMVPMDEALASAAVDLSGRPYSRIQLGLQREKLGQLSCELIPHALSSIAAAARLTLHVEVSHGENDHHKAEAAFKSFALALRQAVKSDGSQQIPSTKGTL